MVALGLAVSACILPLLVETLRRPRLGEGTRATVEKEKPEPGMVRP